MDNHIFDTIKEKGAALRLRLSNNWQDFSERLHHKHRLVIMDTDTLKENFSAELTGVNIFTYVSLSVIVMIVLTILLVAFTPLHHLVPGYIKPDQREEIVRSAQVIDSLETVIDHHERMIAIIQDVVSGKPLTAEQVQQVEEVSDQAVVYRHSKADSLLRLDVEARKKNEQERKKSEKERKKK